MLSSSRMSGREVVLLLFSPEAAVRELEVGEDEEAEQVMMTGPGLSVSEVRLSW